MRILLLAVVLAGCAHVAPPTDDGSCSESHFSQQESWFREELGRSEIDQGQFDELMGQVARDRETCKNYE